MSARISVIVFGSAFWLSCRTRHNTVQIFSEFWVPVLRCGARGVYIRHIKFIQAAGGADSSLPDGEVPFTPTCRERTGDIIEYNYFVFPQFGANMALPSGSIIHRNYLCFIWHPAFEELRQVSAHTCIQARSLCGQLTLICMTG